MTDRDLTRAEVEAWISEGSSHGVHIHAFSRILRQFLRCMDERALAQTETADLLTVSREECTRLVERAETAETENARLREALQAATAYIEDLEEHEGAEGFSSSTGILGAAYRAALQPAPTVTVGWPTEEGEGSIIVGNVKGDSHD